KAFRVYNKRTKRVEENLHINFLEDQPNVAGTGPDWMFDLDFLTNTMNYIHVSVENQVNVDACTQDSYVAGSSGYDNEPTQEYILLLLHPHRTRISVEDVVQDAQEKPSEDAPKDKDVQDSEDVADKEGQHKLTEDEQALKDDLEKLATNINKLSTGRPSVSTSTTPYVSTANTSTSANTGESSFVYLGGKIPNDASTLPNADLPIDPNMSDLEDDSDAFPNDGIFNGAYDDDDVGAVANFNNMDNTINVSPIPTLRIHKDHPKEEPKNISQALQDERWVEAMKEELLQFKLQKVWILADLPSGKKAIGTKWVFRNKKDERSIVVKNKARLVAQGFRQEEGIDYDEVKQQPDGIFISQDKYVVDILKKFDFWSIRTATTPIESNKTLVKNKDGEDVDVHVYRSMIGSLMYLTASRPDIMFAVCACARFQVTPKASHLNAVKRIFRYLKHQPKLGLWYPKDSPFELEAFLDSDYGGASLDRKSTTCGCQFLAANCCGQVLWIQNQMMDYGFNFMNTKIHIDNESTISVIKNPVAYSRTKHIEIRFHFIRDCYEKRLIEVVKIHTDSNAANLLTKGFDVTRFNFLVVSIELILLGTSMDLRMDGRCAGSFSHIRSKPTESVGFSEIVDFLKGSSLRYALTHNPTIYASLVKLFWQTATVRTLANGIQELVASIDNKEYTITEASVRSKLQLADAKRINNLPDAKIYDGLGTLRGYAGEHVPLLSAMLASAAEDQGEGSTNPAEPTPTPVDPAPSTSQPSIPSTTEPLQQPSPPRQLDIQDTEIPQSQGPTFIHVVDEATTIGVGVSTKGATTTTTSLDAGLDSGNIHESPLRSNEVPLNKGRTSRSAEDSMTLQDLMELAVLTLVERVKILEKALKRRTKKVVISESEDEEPEDQGRKIQDIDDDPLVSLVKESMQETDFVTPTKVSASGEAQEEDISLTILEAAKTLSKVASQKAMSTNKGKRYKRRKMSKGKYINTGLDTKAEVNTSGIEVNTCSEEVNTGGQREGKAPMTTEEVQASKRTKVQIQQEEADLAEAMRLQALHDEEASKQIHLDALLAKRISEEQ
ncbi:putative ribonuclease H-like domain-containing protein, partial [Tanacetum coccineum]